jgi:macrodomain Ter protein organizer (MatP/YcbG family)
MDKKKQKSIHIDIELWKKLKAKALNKTLKTNTNITITDLVEKAIKKYLDKNNKEI